jgi:hypothetical protein
MLRDLEAERARVEELADRLVALDRRRRARR